MDGKERTIRKEVHLAKTSPHRDRGWQTDYPQVGSGSRNLGFAKRTTNGVYPARVWLANNVQVLRDVTYRACIFGHKISSYLSSDFYTHIFGLPSLDKASFTTLQLASLTQPTPLHPCTPTACNTAYCGLTAWVRTYG